MSLDTIPYEPSAFDTFQADPELPTYAQIRPPRRQQTIPSDQPTSHTCSLSNKSGNTWLTMKCTSRAARPQQNPRVLEGDNLEGSVEVNLPNWKTIKCVRVSVLGELVTSAQQRDQFLQLSQELWSSNMEAVSPTVDSMRFNKGSLRGVWIWPFTFTLPRTVETKRDGHNRDSYRLPGSFISKQSNYTVLYKLVTTIVAGKFIPDYTLETSITYIPFIKPEPPSSIRQLAYYNNCPIVGPDGDPEGWHTSSPVTITGSLFGERSVSIECQLWLAKPLCYTRGTVIPLFLTLRCSDSQALDILSSSDAPVVRLRRSLSLGIANSPIQAYGAGHKGMLRTAGSRGMYETSGDTTSYMQLANWWRSPYDSEGLERNMCALQGEIHLSPALSPPAQLGKYQLLYDVAIYSPDAVGFVNSSPTKKPLQVTSVEIATLYADGPRPMKYSPPKYDDLTRAAEDIRVEQS
ncbi:hypothetical protein BDY19DRAFT_995046 [Irpex rosettiformis]|uniref:Uncharacterized protein n=1 Tax=Irpex rosettiformis TaxID=378272 RepID=A0ACB8TZA8_9APHY|nr:hypothetical protein BDY19DRAFT_995046 [Irpex rosettiformis]